MPTTIPITCTCGAVAHAPAQYAGRTVACKVCGQALKVPGARVAPATQAVPVPVVAPAPPAPPALRPATLDDLLVVLKKIDRRLEILVFVFVLLPLGAFLLWLIVMVIGALAISSRA